MPDQNDISIDRGVQNAHWNSLSSAQRLQVGSAEDAAPKLALPWVLRLRYGMVFSGAAVLIAAAPILRIHLPVLLWALLPLVLILLSNLWLSQARQLRADDVKKMLGSIFVFDTICLTMVLALTGGPLNPFTLLYLVQITLSVVVLKKEWTWALGVLSAVCFGVLFVLNVPLDGIRVLPKAHGIFPHLVGMWVAFVAAAALISFFTGRVSDALRLREQEVLALQERIARQERLTALGTLAAGAAHELSTPLGTIAVVACELDRNAAHFQQAEELRQDAKLIRSEVERCQRILQRMSAEGAEPGSESLQMITVGELLDQALGQISTTQRGRVSVAAEDAQLLVTLPVETTVQSLGLLLGNALDAGAENLRVLLKARCDGRDVSLSICDSGCGMDEDVLWRVADPFFTTKEPGKGMGLGAFLVRTFAERVGGSLSYRSAPGQGTIATLTLPAKASAQTGGVRVVG